MVPGSEGQLLTVLYCTFGVDVFIQSERGVNPGNQPISIQFYRGDRTLHNRGLAKIDVKEVGDVRGLFCLCLSGSLVAVLPNLAGCSPSPMWRDVLISYSRPVEAPSRFLLFRHLSRVWLPCSRRDSVT